MLAVIQHKLIYIAGICSCVSLTANMAGLRNWSVQVVMMAFDEIGARDDG